MPAQVHAIRLGVCVHVRVGVCTETCEHMFVCCISMGTHAGDAMSVGCLYFSVRQFHFVLYD